MLYTLGHINVLSGNWRGEMKVILYIIGAFGLSLLLGLLTGKFIKAGRRGTDDDSSF